MTRITRDTPAHEIDRVLKAYDADVFYNEYKSEYIVDLYPRSGPDGRGRGKTLWAAINRALREVARG